MELEENRFSLATPSKDTVILMGHLKVYFLCFLYKLFIFSECYSKVKQNARMIINMQIKPNFRHLGMAQN